MIIKSIKILLTSLLLYLFMILFMIINIEANAAQPDKNVEVTNENTNTVEGNITSNITDNSTSSNTSDSKSSAGAEANNSISYDVSSASAAPVFSSGCSSGASVQGIKGGFSSGTVNVICRNLMMADAYLKLANMAATQPLKEAHMGIAITYLEEAGYVVKKTSKTGFIAQVSSDLALPLAAILLLILL